MNTELPPSARLRAVVVPSRGRRPKVTIGAVVDGLGEEAPATLLLVLATGALVPGPAPMFAFAIIVLAIVLLAGQDGMRLPERLRNRKVSARTIERAGNCLEPLERRFGIDRSQLPVPRLLVGATAAAAIVDALLIMVPIPFGNLPPAFAAMLLGLGLVGGNRTALLLGAVATAASVVIVVTLLWVGVDLLHALIGRA